MRYCLPTAVLFSNMSKIRYTDYVTAIHELGHAILACALGLPWSCVEIREDPAVGFVGKCHLTGQEDEWLQAQKDAFTMAGPLLQLLMESASVGEYRSIFEPSLFSNAKSLQEQDTPLQDLFWSSDFYKGKFIAYALDIQSGRKPENPHLFTVEAKLRIFFQEITVQKLVKELAGKLSSDKSLSCEFVLTEFNKKVPETLYTNLREFIEGLQQRQSIDEFTKEFWNSSLKKQTTD